MSDPFIGEVKLVGFNFAPRGWAVCDGQLMQIADQSALFALINTWYGGNGTSNFALPDLRGRSPVSMGQGIGLTPHYLGQYSGSEYHYLSTQNLPSHTHLMNVYIGEGHASSPQSNFLAAAGAAGFTGTVPAGIPVSGTTTIQGKTGALQNGQTSSDQSISGTVTPKVYAGTANTTMDEDAISSTGSNTPVHSQPPTLAMLYVMALQGLFPPRN